MTNNPERQIQMVRLEGTTPDEIALHYQSVVNEFFATPSSAFSQYYGELMDMIPQQPALREIQGVYYAELECLAGRYATKEEFFGAEINNDE